MNIVTGEETITTTAIPIEDPSKENKLKWLMIILYQMI
jgi:hypothetical protein